MTTQTRSMSPQLTVGQTAARLGVSPSTLRSWERRYGLVPSGRSVGGHRRYRAEDVAVLELMRQLIAAGHRPQAAAFMARRDATHQADGPPTAGSGGAVGPGPARLAEPPALSLPDDDAAVRALAAAASDLDPDRCTRIVEQSLRERGVEATWDALLRPVLVAAGAHWARTGQGVEVEHLLTQATIDALVSYSRTCPRPDGRPPIVLACAPADQHSLPLHVLATALAERQVPSRVLGTHVPASAVAAAVHRTSARAVFLWAQLPDPRNDAAVDQLAGLNPPLRLVLGGPGWEPSQHATQAHYAGSLGAAARRLAPDVLHL